MGSEHFITGKHDKGRHDGRASLRRREINSVDQDIGELPQNVVNHLANLARFVGLYRGRWHDPNHPRHKKS